MTATMTDTTLTADAISADATRLHALIADYFAAFSADSAAAAAFYGAPVLLASPAQLQTLDSPEAVQSLLANTLQRLKKRGYCHSRVSDPRVVLLNSATALYAAVAIRLKADSTVLQELPVTYLLHKQSGDWKIHVVISTAADKLIDVRPPGTPLTS